MKYVDYKVETLTKSINDTNIGFAKKIEKILNLEALHGWRLKTISHKEKSNIVFLFLER